MSKLVLIGGGGHCKSVLDSALAMNKYTEIVITDPDIEPGTDIFGCIVAGNDDILQELLDAGFEDAFITVGSIKSCELRVRLSKRAEQLGFHFPVIVDPSAIISNNTRIGDGSFVGKNVVVNSDAIVGKHCIINSGAIIEHDCSVGDFCHVSVGSIICGGVSIGNESFIGAGTTIVNGLKIGDNVMIGAGSLVLHDIDNSFIGHGKI